MAVVVCINALSRLGDIEPSGARHLILLLATFATTTAMATLSYFVLERRFLRLKRRYAPIASGVAAIETARPAA